MPMHLRILVILPIYLAESLLLLEHPNLRRSKSGFNSIAHVCYRCTGLRDRAYGSKLAQSLAKFTYSFPSWRFLGMRANQNRALAQRFGLERVDRSKMPEQRRSGAMHMCGKIPTPILISSTVKLLWFLATLTLTRVLSFAIIRFILAAVY